MCQSALHKENMEKAVDHLMEWQMEVSTKNLELGKLEKREMIRTKFHHWRTMRQKMLRAHAIAEKVLKRFTNQSTNRMLLRWRFYTLTTKVSSELSAVHTKRTNDWFLRRTGAVPLLRQTAASNKLRDQSANNFRIRYNRLSVLRGWQLWKKSDTMQRQKILLRLLMSVRTLLRDSMLQNIELRFAWRLWSNMAQMGAQHKQAASGEQRQLGAKFEAMLNPQAATKQQAAIGMSVGAAIGLDKQVDAVGAELQCMRIEKVNLEQQAANSEQKAAAKISTLQQQQLEAQQNNSKLIAERDMLQQQQMEAQQNNSKLTAEQARLEQQLALKVKMLEQQQMEAQQNDSKLIAEKDRLEQQVALKVKMLNQQQMEVQQYDSQLIAERDTLEQQVALKVKMLEQQAVEALQKDKVAKQILAQRDSLAKEVTHVRQSAAEAMERAAKLQYELQQLEESVSQLRQLRQSAESKLQKDLKNTKEQLVVAHQKTKQVEVAKPPTKPPSNPDAALPLSADSPCAVC